MIWGQRCSISQPDMYRIAGNFQGVQFLRMGDLPTLIFAYAYGHPIMCSYKRAYFAGLIFSDRLLTAKTSKIGLLENFPLYIFRAPRLHYSLLCYFSLKTIFQLFPVATLHGALRQPEVHA